jgi:uncharacterized repeat protein (TIGR03803 family)
MRDKKIFVGLRVALILALALFAIEGAAGQEERVLHNFSDKDGANPYSSLIADAAGNLYGTTSDGGSLTCTSGCGTVFELTPKVGGGWTEKTLHRFTENGMDGVNPFAGLVFDASGNLYGTTGFGGMYNEGVVFEMSPRVGGGWNEAVLYSFGAGTDGLVPETSLIFDTGGNLYGATSYGGVYGVGTVFEVTPTAGGTWTETVLHSFNDDGTDGTYPRAALTLDSSGNLYSTTNQGGSNGYGTVFELAPMAGGTWSETILHSFNNNGTDGSYPYAGLTFDSLGNLYGMTALGGTYDAGAVFEMMPSDGSWTEAVLHSFNNNGSDRYEPQAGPIFDPAGNLYGTTSYGGAFNDGTVFELIPTGGGNWTEKLLRSFNGTDGSHSYGSLLIDASGDLYGTTLEGGAHGYGLVFEIKH